MDQVGNITSGNQSLLMLNASSSTTNNSAVIEAVPASAIRGSPSNFISTAFESPILSVSSVNQSQQPQLPPPRRESHLRNWFTSSSSNSTSSAVNSGGNSSITSSSSAVTATQSALVGSLLINKPDISSPGPTSSLTNIQSPSDSAQSTKNISKISYGELFISKFNKSGKNPTVSTNFVNQQRVDSSPTKENKIEQQEQQQQQQQKSSRRTTSLLNLFMSNSQGKELLQI